MGERIWRPFSEIRRHIVETDTWTICHGQLDRLDKKYQAHWLFLPRLQRVQYSSRSRSQTLSTSVLGDGPSDTTDKLTGSFWTFKKKADGRLTYSLFQPTFLLRNHRIGHLSLHRHHEQ